MIIDLTLGIFVLERLLRYLTICCVPITLGSCTYLFNTNSPDPFDAISFKGYSRNGMQEWETIKPLFTLKKRPDYCTYSSESGYVVVSCYQRKNNGNIPLENNKFINTICTRTIPEEFQCKENSSAISINFDSYRKMMRFSGDGSPTAKEKKIIFFRDKLLGISLISALCFPFLFLATIIWKPNKK